ncbi:MAG TPA: haloacid dehalogenase-like hydrolase [Gemmatimonadales bacterium]|nr:haloacid dehalogenase-like hydrolase [Gemmatimonadales bacterium]
MTIALFWDIDGTLLWTGRAGIIAWERAVEEVLGTGTDLTDLPTAGLTDYEIGATLLDMISPGAAGEVGSLVRAYERHLPDCLPLRQGTVLPGVREILEGLNGRRDVLSLLLTGNTRAGAAAKLGYYGLGRYFRDGAFAEQGLARAGIARAAVELARTLAGDSGLEERYVIGDTPHDVHCGRAVGARTLAVATGPVPFDELVRHEPWLVMPRLPGVDEFKTLIGLRG